jgi:hypothetical protein
MSDMDPSHSEKTPLTRLVLFIVCLSIAGILIAGVMYCAGNPPVQNALVPPTNSADPVLFGHKDDTSPDGTNCHGVFNLQEDSRQHFAAPTVVDINEANGNLLVRGPLPLIVRDGSDPTTGCRNKADWKFAYDNLNTMIQKERTQAPAYFSGTRKGILGTQMQDFDLANYHLIVVSLLNTADNTDFFNVENAAFGENYSRCSAPIVSGTVSNQPGNLIWSSTSGCPNDAVCRQNLYADGGGICSYNNLMAEISTLMNEKDPSGKKRLIYYHCTHGADRTGAVTMGYLMNVSGLSYADALKYTTNLGQESTGFPHRPNDDILRLETMYCDAIGGKCPAGASSPGAPVAGTTPVPTRTLAPVVTPPPSITTVPVQTVVPDKPYNPAVSGGVNY